MASRITIEELSIAGFRAYLEEQSIRLHEGSTAKSLAVYAPNAKGKSSLVDAIDFYLSNDGTLARLGLRRSGTHAGPEALEHVKAREQGFPRQVAMSFRDGKEVFGDSRGLPDHGKSKLTQAGQRVRGARKIDFIVRGYELRRFVEERTSLERYADVSEWFSLSPLLDIQNKLRSLRLGLKRALDDDAAMKERITDLCTITEDAVTEWDETHVLTWINQEQIEKLDRSVVLSELNEETSAFRILEQKAEQEAQRSGLSAIKAAEVSVRNLYEAKTAEQGALPTTSGYIVDLEQLEKNLDAAKEKEQREKGTAEKAVFKDVWEAAEELFDQELDIEKCPVCAMPFEEMADDHRARIVPNIKTELAKLQSYRDAVTARRTAQQNTAQARENVRQQLENCGNLLAAVGYRAEHAARTEVSNYTELLGATDGDKSLPDSSTVKRELTIALNALRDDKEQLETAGGDDTFGKVLGRIKQLIDLKNKIELIGRKNAELEQIYQRLVSTEAFIASQLRSYLQHVLDQLKDRMNEIYKKIQADQEEAPSLRLDLAEETKQPQLHLLVDFAPNREGVMPSGYLSDSQLHTLALSLRLASIEMANKAVPVLVLDDVVTSYDADHRKAIAALFAAELEDTQIVVVTHDEQFFRYLQDHLPEKSWYFKRITALAEDYGPRFHDHKVTEQMIQDKWDRDESAANEIRQAEEEWLLAKAREFGVSVRIRDIHKAHKYDRGELARALHSFLVRSDLTIPRVPGIANPFLTSLQKGAIENFGSHFSDDPNAWGSIGDERIRWSEFQEFCGYFVCQSCGSKKFKRPKTGMKKASCYKCEIPFAFCAE